ncbi:MAG: Phenylalanine-tRNA ligase alpha subunit [Parcubacteria group bacterium GW2011_GWA2_47_8b]|nr:MAG: Phenylalanine-tRNA ligase alpha subunit [Parcubacteria group bacterium GW2011_GWA2_47_8b]
MKDIGNLKKSALQAVGDSKDVKELEAVRVRYLGRKDGELTKVLRSLKDLSVAQRRKVGSEANALRQDLEGALVKKLAEFTMSKMAPKRHSGIQFYLKQNSKISQSRKSNPLN